MAGRHNTECLSPGLAVQRASLEEHDSCIGDIQEVVS
jgi:hypothetical protein